MIIIGAGLAGCLAAIMTGANQVFEAQKSLPLSHMALLRFRSERISHITGIPLKRVTVHKSIFIGGECFNFAPPQLLNMYSRKVTGGSVIPRSIGDLDSCIRYIPPVNFHELLAELIKDKIKFDRRLVGASKHKIDFDTSDGDYFNIDRENDPVISTIPMPVLARVTKLPVQGEFKKHSIHVVDCLVDGCDVHQTIYYPGTELPVYRASLVGNRLIIESMANVSTFNIRYVAGSLGLDPDSIRIVKTGLQSFGKIVPINDKDRKSFMYANTVNHNIFSLGRFACWRNILLDDVYDDIFAIKAMIGKSHYDINLFSK